LRIVIVGGASSLAQALIPVLSEFAEVVTAGRRGCDIPLDLRSAAERVELPRDTDFVVNTAACYGGGTPVEMLETEGVNAVGVLKLCRACTEAGTKHLVQISSIFACLGEGSPFYSIYALSKRHADELARLYSAQFGLPLTILRPSQMYGVGESSRKNQPFLSSIIDRAATNVDVLLAGSHDALRNFIHVEDVARIVALAIQHGIEGTYSCANAKNVSYAEVAAAAIEAFGSTSKIRYVAEERDVPDNIFEPDESLYRAIGFYPQISIADGMEKEAAYRKAFR
jgi:nucleoside-diphosphate-sugar epimerase